HRGQSLGSPGAAHRRTTRVTTTKAMNQMNRDETFRSTDMKRILRQIIAIGGFSKKSRNRSLEGYVLAQARRRNPAVCFLATASGDAESYISKFYKAFAGYRCRPTHVPLFGRTPDLRQALLTQ